MQTGYKIIVASSDPELADDRRRVLESAGYSVLSVNDVHGVRKACREHPIALVIFGFSVDPASKRHMWAAVKQACDRSMPPILELDNGAPPVLTDSHRYHLEVPEDLIGAVEAILGTKQ